MKREKRLTKREQKALRGPRAGAKAAEDERHIHCVACGRHLNPAEFDAEVPTATHLRCKHNGSFASCVEHTAETRALLEAHDRTGQAVQAAAAWH